MGQLIFTCPQTGKTLRSSLDWLSVDLARSATVKIRCPYCFRVHDLPVQAARDAPAQGEAAAPQKAPDSKKKPRRSGAVGRE
jgi:hypothetical protein